MPRLLTVCNFFDTHRGGLEIVAGRIARELSARGFEVTWLATDESPIPPDRGSVRAVAVRAFNITERKFGIPFPFLSPSAIRRLISEVRSHDVLVLHDSLYMSTLIACLAAKWLRKPAVLIQHIGHVPYRSFALKALITLANATVGRFVLSRVDQVVFISEGVRAYFSNVAYRREPVLIFNGVDTQIFRLLREPDPGEVRSRLGLPTSTPIALFVGRFVEKKGLQLLRKAAQSRPGVLWVCAGWGVVDPESWGLSNVRVYSDVRCDSLAVLYQISDVLVLPSVGEGFPLVIQEALACGMPVVCGTQSVQADIAASPFLCGIELDPENEASSVTALVRTVDDVLRKKDRRGEQEISRSDFARERYAWPRIADRYADLLHGLLDHHPTDASKAGGQR